MDTTTHKEAEMENITVAQKTKTYRIRWATEIIDAVPNYSNGFDYVPDQKITRYPIEGHTDVLAADLRDAVEMSEELCDVDFFCPTKKYSASSRDVIGGLMWASDPSLDGVINGRFDYLGRVLPNVETWDFERVRILGVEE